MSATANVIWHDVECGSYDADLRLWRDLAVELGDPILELGAGTGRVALELARLGHNVVAVERDSTLVDELRVRARGLPAQVLEADATAIRLQPIFRLVIAPMQFVQLLDGHAARSAMFASAASALREEQSLVVAFVEHIVEATFDLGDESLAEIAVIDGVTYTSQPLSIKHTGSRIEIVRQRRFCDTNGRGHHFRYRDVLRPVTRELIASEAAQAGLMVARVHTIPGSATDVEYLALEMRRAEHS